MSIPATSIGVVALGAAASLAVGVGIAVVVTLAVTRSNTSTTDKEGSRTVQRLITTSLGRRGDSHPYPVFSAFFARTACESQIELVQVSDRPMVSVIIPSFRRARSAERAIESVLVQQYPPKALEVLLIDDCSPNKQSYDRLCKRYADDPRVRYVRLEKNVGQSGARNHAVSIANGEYVGFLDDDDAWLPSKVATQVACMQASGADFCCTDGVRGRGPYLPSEAMNDEQKLPLQTYNTSGAVLEILRRRFGEKGIPRELTLADIHKHNIVITSSVMMTRELFLRSQHGFTVGKHCAEDYELWQELLGPSCGGKGLYISAPLFYYDEGHAGGSWWSKRNKTKMS